MWKRLGRLSRWPSIRFGGALLAFVFAAWQLAESFQNPTGWRTVFVVATLGYTFWGIRPLLERYGELEEQQEPKIGIVHVAGSIPNFLREANMGGGGQERRHIIAIENLSSNAILGLQAVAESFEPYLQGATWVDAQFHPLRVPADNAGRFDLSRGDGTPTRYIEIFQELSLPGQTAPILTFVYDSTALNALQRFMVGDWFAVTVRVQGDVKPERARLVAKRNPLTNKFDVAVSDEPMPTVNPSNYQVVRLTQGAAPATEPLPPAMPSEAPPDEEVS